jgi:hypothetical protein
VKDVGLWSRYIPSFVTISSSIVHSYNTSILFPAMPPIPASP